MRIPPNTPPPSAPSSEVESVWHYIDLGTFGTPAYRTKCGVNPLKSTIVVRGSARTELVTCPECLDRLGMWR